MLPYLQKHLWIISIFLFASIHVTGQEFEDFCRELFETAFTQVGQNCAGLAGNSVCYGYGAVSSQYVDLNGNPIAAENPAFLEEGDQTFFYDAESEQILRSVETMRFNPLLDATIDGIHVVKNGENLFRIALLYGVDINELAEFNGITNTAEIFVGQELRIPNLYNADVSAEAQQEQLAAFNQWGIAVMYTAASIPQQMGSLGARVMVFGETQITDATPIENIFIPDRIVTVSVENVGIYSSPPEYPLASEIIDTVSGEFEADAISPDGAWVRVFHVFEGRYGTRGSAWLPVESLLDAPEELAELEVLGANDASPMQNIELTMSVGQQACGNVETAGVIVQAEDELEIDVSINGVPVRLSSAIFIQLIGPDTVRIVALDGIIQLFPESGEPLVLIPGFSIIAGYGCIEDCEDANEESVDNPESTEEAESRELIVGEPTLEENFMIDTTDFLRIDSPDNIIAPLPEVTIITSSGTGTAIRIIVISDSAQTERLAAYCADGLLPDYICVHIN